MAEKTSDSKRKLKKIEVRCGKVIGCIKASSPGHAFRRIMKLGKLTKKDWALLARFKIHDGTARQYVWQHQEPESLYSERQHAKR